jgi:HAE1 family hydrophobic/amphiphilic exporter-1
MNIADICIRRPVLTLMLMASLLVFGVLGYSRLGVDQFPHMEFPMVIVTAILPGAAPEVMEEDVTDVLEENVNTVPGLHTLRSQTSHGLSLVIAEFELGHDIDTAAQDVRDKLARARALLPTELEPPAVEKLNPADQPILWIPVNSDRDPVQTTEFVLRNMVPVMQTIPGVAGVTMFGRRERAIRVWLDGDALRARGLAATDVIFALRREHVELPGGRVESKQIEYSVKTAGEFKTLEELGGMVIARQGGGAPVHLRDVARIEDGSEDPRTVAFYNGKMTVGMGLQKQSMANTVAITNRAFAAMESLNSILPAGMSLPTRDGLIDFAKPIREAVDETIFTLWTGAILATLTVWAFLRRVRPTLIVGAAIPVSLIATFGVLWLAGFTLNVMTLLALALAVGVVIDDAIVVLENIERHREAGAAPREAALTGTREIAFAAIVATLSIVAVFLPVAAVTGIVGNFLKEFGLTVAASVMISLLVALTLTPMLAARMTPPREREHGSIYHWLELGFLWLERGYVRTLDWALARRAATLGIALASFAAAIGFGTRLGSEFFPPEDQGRVFAMIDTPPGTTLRGTRDVLERDMEYWLAQPEVSGLFSAIGVGGPGRPGRTNQAVMVAVLESKDERERTAQELAKAARVEFGRIPGQKFTIIDSMNMGAGGSRQAAFEVELRGNVSLNELDRLANAMIAKLRERPGFVDLDKSLQLGLPEVRVVPDREKAAALGIDATSLATVVQAMIGGMDVATFKEEGHRYDIRLRLEDRFRTTPDSIQRLYARAGDGSLVELGNLISIETGAAPSTITRSQRQRSVSVTGNLSGKTLGDAIRDARAVGAEVLPEGVTLHLAGQAEAFRESFSQFGIALLLGILVIYMVMAAQFESLVHPLTVMLALPLAMVGALGGLWLCGMTINLFSMIGIILLLGLVTKNSVLLVDYANQLRERGMDKFTAMRTAAPIRMRPVLMTAVSMIFGVIPAATGLGPGAESRQPMAVATAFGMLSSMLLTLVVVPVFYLVVDDAVDWTKARARRLLGRSGPAEATPKLSSGAAS